MAETFPRFGLPDLDFLTVDAGAVESSILTAYEAAAGRTLADGDPVRLFLLTVAAAITQLRGAVNIAARQNLLSYARGGFLDSIAALFGVERLPASSAAVTLRFGLSQALAQAYTIPAGTKAGNGTVRFATAEDLTIAAGSVTGDVTAVCETAGVVGNGWLAGQIASLDEPLPYVASVANTAASTGGADAEDDERLASRVRLAPNAFSTAGAEKAYLYHIYTANGSISDAVVDSPTPGVVNCYVLLDGAVIPGSALLGEIEDYLNAEERRPLTDEVHVLAPTGATFAVNVEYWINASDAERSAEIQAAVAGAAESYRDWQISAIGRDIDPGKLVQAVMEAGAGRIDFSTLSPSFTALDSDEVARCSSITVTFEGYKDI